MIDLFKDFSFVSPRESNGFTHYDVIFKGDIVYSSTFRKMADDFCYNFNSFWQLV